MHAKMGNLCIFRLKIAENEGKTDLNGYAGATPPIATPQALGVNDAVPSNCRLSISEYSGVELHPPPSTWTPINSMPEVRFEAKPGQSLLVLLARMMASEATRTRQNRPKNS